MKLDFYKNYYSNNDVYADKTKKFHKTGLKLLKNNINNYISNLNKNIKILEVGSGTGSFTNYCHELGFKNYIGFELDKKVAEQTQKIFQNYNFYTTDIFEFLGTQKNNFDIVFISHVFEHLEENKAYEISQLIYNSLKKGGIWINTMPNAEAPYVSNRYLDITHQKLYCKNSFSQILLEVGFKKENIVHREQILFSNKILNFILLISKQFHKLFLLSAGINPPKIFTQNFFTFARK